jgi:hypothetical protein
MKTQKKAAKTGKIKDLPLGKKGNSVKAGAAKDVKQFSLATQDGSGGPGTG